MLIWYCYWKVKVFNIYKYGIYIGTYKGRIGYIKGINKGVDGNI